MAVATSLGTPVMLGAPQGNDVFAANRGNVKEIVHVYWSDAPIMRSVAWCESRLRQFDNDGNPIRGEINSGDIGVMQINEYYHRETAQKLGYDIDTLEGNLGYARYLYEREGVRPWNSSAKCWSDGGHIAQK